jgi:hypothetical protein
MHVDILEPIGPVDETTEVPLAHIREADWTPTDTLLRVADSRAVRRERYVIGVRAAWILAGAMVLSSALLGIAWWLT